MIDYRRHSSHDEMILKPSIFKWGGYLLFSILMLLTGWLALTRGSLLGLLPISFGLLGGIICSTAVLSSRLWLRLTPEGFSFGTLRRRCSYKWTDIVEIGVARVGDKKVCFTFRSDYPGEERLRAINKSSFGFERFLPDTYGKKPMELAQMLVDWRLRYGQPNMNHN